MPPRTNLAKPIVMALAAILSLTGLSLPGLASPARLEVSGGIHAPTGTNEREVFGLAPQFTIGIASDFANGASSIALDIGYIRSGGRDGGSPTFEVSESHYFVVPIVASVRTRLAPGSQNPWPRLYAGFFVEIMSTRYTNANDDTFSGATVGAGLELRPEFRLSDRWNAFGRSRLSLVDAVTYRGGSREISYSALSMELGLSASLR
ncbi:MAG: hypothetical protein SGI90_14135 [Candidatus Eisenbacteria bacterium]|nr:hypothetical protein [Candidatus Eisenbacteria bacterium]